MLNVLRVIPIVLMMASVACSQGPSAPAINPSTLTPVARATSVPTSTSGPKIQPAAIVSTIQPDLKVNGSAIIHTTAGDKLRIHSRPSFDAPVVFELEDGILVTIIAGPQVIVPDRWWQIEIVDGKSGWAVEAAEGVQTLLPGQ